MGEIEVRCALCGMKEEITKIHKDYQRLASNPEASFFCARCRAKVTLQAQEAQKPRKPI